MFVINYNINFSKMKYQKMNDQLKAELRKAVLLLRYRSTRPTTKSQKYVSYGRIAQIVNLTVYEV